MPAAVSPAAPASTPAPATAAFTPAIFVALSSGLTGVSAAQLKPALDPIGIAGQYFDTLVAGVPAATLDRLAAVFLAAPTPAEGAAAVLADSELGSIGRSIIKLWLLGSWYAPSAPTVPVKVVSAQAYKESLVWRAMQSHPMGYSMFTFGHWSKTPPPLDKFITPAP